MRIENLVVNCTARYPRTCRRTPFEVVVYELNYSSEDKELMDLLRTKAEELARQVNPGAANNSMHERSPERILADCIAGVVSEYFWKLYLNSEENVVSETEFDDASRQIDLKVISNNPLAELNKRIFKSANRFVVNVVYILKDCKCTYFPEYSGKQSYCIFSIISHYHELIA